MNLEKWQIYKLKTNANKDVWTKQDLKNGYISDKNLVGKTKYRNTIFIKPIANLNNGDKLLIIAQTNSNNPNQSQYNKWIKEHGNLKNFPEYKKIPFLNISDKIISTSNHEIEGYISPINVRLALLSEFDNRTTERYGIQGMVMPKYQNDYFDNKLKPLIKYNGRTDLFDIASNGEFNNLSEKSISQIISIDQFNIHELSSKFNPDLSSKYKLDNSPALLLKPELYEGIHNDVIKSIPDDKVEEILNLNVSQYHKSKSKAKLDPKSDLEPTEA